MQGETILRVFCIGVCCILSAAAYMVPPPLGLDKLTADSDLVFKGTAISTEPVKDDWFKQCAGFDAVETRFKIISVIKGQPPEGPLRFRHYEQLPSQNGMMYEPLHYRFESNATFIVFARKGDSAGIFRQFQPIHTGLKEQGIVPCADDSPAAAGDIRQIVWHELTGMLKGSEATNVTHALHLLDAMSKGGNSFSVTEDFARSNVIAAVRVLMLHPSPEIAQQAVEVVGCHNPYMSDENQEHWLNAISPTQIPGLAAMDTNFANIGAQMCMSQLVAIIQSPDTKVAVGTRALAIRALGRSQLPLPAGAVFRWCASPEAELRASATVLLSDFPGPAAKAQWEKLAADGAAKVRAATAIAIGYSRESDLISLLGKMLNDEDASVRRAASSSLQSFPATNEIVADIMKANLDKPEFGPLFLNSLARENAAPYLDALAKVVQEQTTPSNWHVEKSLPTTHGKSSLLI